MPKQTLDALHDQILDREFNLEQADSKNESLRSQLEESQQMLESANATVGEQSTEIEQLKYMVEELRNEVAKLQSVRQSAIRMLEI